MSWIQTFSGAAFSPMDPRPEAIHIVDIAHALSMICRFNGHCQRFYSVAEHCVRMSEEIASPVAIHALMHDAAEAYVSDVARPIKPFIGGFREIEDKIMAAIQSRFGFRYELGDELAIKTADLRMLATERLQLMTLHAPEWDSLRDIEPYEIFLGCWSPEFAKEEFLRRFTELGGFTTQKEPHHAMR